MREPYGANLNRNFVRNNLVVKLPLLSSGDNGLNLLENNTLPGAEESSYPMDYYLQPEVLNQYGLSVIPFEKIGTWKNAKSKRKQNQ
ncbi:MAG: hypothetical protein J6R98_04885 [Bacteroidaceae bacterium]|nr:hypothetical protein [Bacteroidaceae bacterium]